MQRRQCRRRLLATSISAVAVVASRQRRWRLLAAAVAVVVVVVVAHLVVGRLLFLRKFRTFPVPDFGLFSPLPLPPLVAVLLPGTISDLTMMKEKQCVKLGLNEKT